MKLFNKNGKFKKNIIDEKNDELSEEMLEDVVGGIPYDYAKQRIETLKEDELTEKDLMEYKGGVPYSEEERESLLKK